MKIAIYARVSSETQAKEGTINSQIEALKDYAKAHDLTISHECIDDGYSGTTLERPGLDQLRDLTQSGSIEGVLILSPDRLSRNQANQIILLEEFKKRKIQVIFTNQNFENNPEGNLMMNIQGVIAEYERAKIIDRMRRGTIHAIKKGQINGSNPPYGYCYIPKDNNSVGHWEINPEEARIVRYVYDLYINQDVKGTAIVKRLRNENIPCRNLNWWSGQIYSILKNEVYTGMAYMLRHHKVESKRTPKSKQYRKNKNSTNELRPREDWFGIPVPAIIDREVWNKAQELLKQNAYRARRNNNKHNYLLRGLVVCGLCGSMVSGYVSNKSTYYSCGAKRNKNVTSKPHDEIIQVKHKPFDEKIWSGLTELLSDPENIKAQLGKRIKAKKEKLSFNQSFDEFDKELNQLDVQEKRILDAYREAIISLEELKAQKMKISDRRGFIEAKKKAILSHTEGLGQQKITMGMLGDVSARFQRAMAKADFAKREKLANLLVNSVTLKTDKAIVNGNIPIDKLDALTTPHLSGAFFLLTIYFPRTNNPSRGH
ncbi:MAG: recombinase family protein [Chloroflexi bacterium]|nr:recombinase family protein [Chloroflexota bacterium]